MAVQQEARSASNGFRNDVRPAKIPRWRPGLPGGSLASEPRAASREIRRGFTIVELLVTVAILAVLVGLLVPAMQAARASARRVACTNQIRQLIVATQNLHAANEQLPPLAPADNAPNSLAQLNAITSPGPYRGRIGFTVFTWLLPHLEMAQLFDACATYSAANGGFTAESVTTPHSTPVPAYLCPDEPNPTGPRGYGRGLVDGWGGPTWWGTSNYAANYYCFGRPAAGNVEGSNTFAHFLDGLSTTVVYTERYANCTNTGGYPVFTSLWCDASSYWRSVFCLNNLSRTPAGAGYPACAKFQTSPHWSRECDGSRPQSPHHGGIGVALADGSVRFVAAEISDGVWAMLCDPRDQGIVGEW